MPRSSFVGRVWLAGTFAVLLAGCAGRRAEPAPAPKVEKPRELAIAGTDPADSQAASPADTADSAQGYRGYSSTHGDAMDLGAPGSKGDLSNADLWESANFRLAVTDMLRLHVIESWETVDVGRLQVVAGDGYSKVKALDYYLERLRRAYGEVAYTVRGSTDTVIELYRDGKKFAEFSRVGLLLTAAPR